MIWKEQHQWLTVKFYFLVLCALNTTYKYNQFNKCYNIFKTLRTVNLVRFNLDSIIRTLKLIFQTVHQLCFVLMPDVFWWLILLLNGETYTNCIFNFILMHIVTILSKMKKKIAFNHLYQQSEMLLHLQPKGS